MAEAVVPKEVKSKVRELWRSYHDPLRYDPDVVGISLDDVFEAMEIAFIAGRDSAK